MKRKFKRFSNHPWATFYLLVSFIFLASPRAAHALAIQNIVVVPTFDANTQPTYPYTINYDLTSAALVSASISKSNGTIIRTLLTNKLQADETVSTATIVWNGQTDAGQFVPIGIFTLKITATDASVSTSSATPATQGITVASSDGAIASESPQKLFESSAFVYPNPVRNGQATFQYEAVRANATVTLKVYTIDGTEVLSQTFGGLLPASINSYSWNVTNQSGRKLGRGLYYYVLKEVDSSGTLQTVKKMAVIQ